MAKSAKSLARQVFNSSFSKKGWIVTRSGKTISSHNSQREAEAAAVVAARKVPDGGGLAQAVLHKTDGTLREERTYGKDRHGRPNNRSVQDRRPFRDCQPLLLRLQGQGCRRSQHRSRTRSAMSWREARAAPRAEFASTRSSLMPATAAICGPSASTAAWTTSLQCRTS